MPTHSSAFALPWSTASGADGAVDALASPRGGRGAADRQTHHSAVRSAHLTPVVLAAEDLFWGVGHVV